MLAAEIAITVPHRAPSSLRDASSVDFINLLWIAIMLCNLVYNLLFFSQCRHHSQTSREYATLWVSDIQFTYQQAYLSQCHGDKSVGSTEPIFLYNTIEWFQSLSGIYAPIPGRQAYVSKYSINKCSLLFKHKMNLLIRSLKASSSPLVRSTCTHLYNSSRLSQEHAAKYCITTWWWLNLYDTNASKDIPVNMPPT